MVEEKEEEYEGSWGKTMRNKGKRSLRRKMKKGRGVGRESTDVRKCKGREK